MMATSEFTKLMIAEGLKQLLETKPFAAVTVQDIARHCGISRNTFYYHFKDKYDLISWIFHSEITPIIDAGISIDSWSDGLLSLCRYMQENKKFYLNVLHFHGQNSFTECLVEFYETLVKNILLNDVGDQVLTPQEIEIVARFYAHGLTGEILHWAQNDMVDDPEPLIQRLKQIGDILTQILAARKF